MDAFNKEQPRLSVTEVKKKKRFVLQPLDILSDHTSRGLLWAIKQAFQSSLCFYVVLAI